MRLKVLFFPIVLILFMYVSIAVVYPDYSEIVLKKGEIIQKETTLNEVRSKQKDIDKLKSALRKNEDKEVSIIAYLDRKKNEEKIITSIDRLVVGSNVGNYSIAIEEIKSVTPKISEPQIQNNSMLGSAGSVSGQLQDQSSSPQEVLPEVSFIGVKLGIAGEYDGIKSFLDKLNKIGFYNQIDSVVIGREKKEGEDGENKNTSFLQADISVKFGYLSMLENKKNLDSELDFSVADEIASSVAGAGLLPEIESGGGRSNPFLP